MLLCLLQLRHPGKAKPHFPGVAAEASRRGGLRGRGSSPFPLLCCLLFSLLATRSRRSESPCLLELPHSAFSSSRSSDFAAAWQRSRRAGSKEIREGGKCAGERREGKERNDAEENRADRGEDEENE
ncbi:hypothetical protein TGARI_371360 [Toxoplasma gondii ARI]|uniref:Uncharacterized protein n=1 Tax=Toxoplasma gondii ARI TaxID=1074872 RepID=A0A139XNN8_TOXGO|nr:hypothetical protein TGARI_371360 [Toxoplasma gondii ARI]